MEIPSDPYLLLYHFWEKIGSTPYFKLGLTIGGTFVFIALVGYVRKHIFQISMHGAFFGFVAGIILMLILDLIILVGLADKATLEKWTHGENRKEATQEILASGIINLGKVLGVSTVPSSAKPKTAQEVIGGYLALPQTETQKIKDLLCPR